MVFRLSIKGVESTSMSMWVLAASKLSSVGRTGKLSGPARKDRKKSYRGSHSKTAPPAGTRRGLCPFLDHGSSQEASQPPLAPT